MIDKKTIIVERSEEKTYKRPIAGQRALNEFDRYAKDATSLCHKIGQDGRLIYAKA